MIIIPAIDLKGGRCVRLLQGRAEDETVYSLDPSATALRWQSLGAELIHIVDLDGAFTGSQANYDSIVKIRKSVDIDLEVGGGIRTIDTIDKLISLGINRVILGTVAVENPELVELASSKHPGKVIIGIDAKNGMAAVKGWVEVSSVAATELAKKMESCGAGGIIYTDISRDGMLSGPNIDATREIVQSVGIPVIASGGISKMQDINNLMAIEGLFGAITGKAIYSGSIDLKDAIRISKGL